MSNTANANSQFFFCVERKGEPELKEFDFFMSSRNLSKKNVGRKSFLSKFVFILSTITYLPC